MSLPNSLPQLTHSIVPLAAQVLGVEKGCSDSAIKKAFRKLAKKHHPDRGGDAEKVRFEVPNCERVERLTRPPPMTTSSS